MQEDEQHKAAAKSKQENEKLRVMEILEATAEEIPFGTIVYRFFVREGKVVRSGWLAFLVMSLIGVWVGMQINKQKIESLTSKSRSLSSEKEDLKRDNQLLIEKNTDLEVTVAPLLARAAKEFPGEEINTSLKKIVERLSQNDPLKESIASAAATATVNVLTDHKPAANIGLGGLVMFGSGSNALLVAKTLNNESLPAPQGQGCFRIACACSIDDPYMGKPISSLIAAGYIEVVFNRNIIATKVKVLGGEVVWVINNLVTLKFTIPEQITDSLGDDAVLFIRNLDDGMRPILPPPPSNPAEPTVNPSPP